MSTFHIKNCHRWLWAAFAACVAIAVGAFFIPAYIIQPFKYQSPRGLVLAMAVKQQSAWLSPLAAVGAILAAILLWGQVSVWKKSLLLLSLLLASAATVMTRVDYFEWMFHPVTAAGFATIPRTNLDASEMVIAVRFGNDVRAYPIREMAYHHILNDVVGSEPIAVTY
jgi:uncharacterized membrane protein